MPGDDITQLTIYRREQVTYASAGQEREGEALGSLGSLAPAFSHALLCEVLSRSGMVILPWVCGLCLWGRAGAQLLLGTKYCQASASVMSV